MKYALVVMLVLTSSCQMRLRPVDPSRGTKPSWACSKEVGAFLVDGSIFGGGLLAGIAPEDLDYRPRALFVSMSAFAAFSTLYALLTERGFAGCAAQHLIYDNEEEGWANAQPGGTKWGMCLSGETPCSEGLMCQDSKLLPRDAPADVKRRARLLSRGVCVPGHVACSEAHACPEHMWCDAELRSPGHEHGTCIPGPKLADPLAPIEEWAPRPTPPIDEPRMPF